jgi:hypothetical protein
MAPAGCSTPRRLQACGPERQQFCGGDRAGGGRILQCLRAHISALPEGCREALAAMREEWQGASVNLQQ